MCDGLICRLVHAANAHRFVPGHLATETPGRHKTSTMDLSFKLFGSLFLWLLLQRLSLTWWQKPATLWALLCWGRIWDPGTVFSEPQLAFVPFPWSPSFPCPPDEKASRKTFSDISVQVLYNPHEWMGHKKAQLLKLHLKRNTFKKGAYMMAAYEATSLCFRNKKACLTNTTTLPCLEFLLQMSSVIGHPQQQGALWINCNTTGGWDMTEQTDQLIQGFLSSWESVCGETGPIDGNLKPVGQYKVRQHGEKHVALSNQTLNCNPPVSHLHKWLYSSRQRTCDLSPLPSETN